MSGQWFITRNNQRYGPYVWEQLIEYAANGNIAPDDLIWGEGMTEWAIATSIAGLFPTFKPESFESPPEKNPPVSSWHQDSNINLPNERIVGIIPGTQRKSGIFSLKTYNLVVTDRRVIFAEATKDMFNQAAKEALEEAKVEGKGLLARTANVFTSQQRIYQKYWNMHPDSILNETADNYAVAFSEIASIRIIRGRYNDNNQQHDQDEMHIKTNREKIKLSFAYSNESKKAREMLQSLLGGKTVR